MPNTPMQNDFRGVESILDAVLFDFDGVLIESMDVKTEAFRQLFSDYPKHVDAVVALHEAHGGISRYVKFEMIYRDVLRQPLSAELKAKLGRRFAEIVVDQVVACPMVEGAKEVLEALAPLLPLCVVSGTPQDELVEIIGRRGLADYFDAIQGSPRGKSEIIGELLRVNVWRAPRVLMIGDTIADFDAARDNGLSFVGRVATGVRSPFPTGTTAIADLTRLANAIDAAYAPLAARH